MRVLLLAELLLEGPECREEREECVVPGGEVLRRPALEEGEAGLRVGELRPRVQAVEERVDLRAGLLRGRAGRDAERRVDRRDALIGRERRGLDERVAELRAIGAGIEGPIEPRHRLPEPGPLALLEGGIAVEVLLRPLLREPPNRARRRVEGGARGEGLEHDVPLARPLLLRLEPVERRERVPVLGEPPRIGRDPLLQRLLVRCPLREEPALGSASEHALAVLHRVREPTHARVHADRGLRGALRERLEDGEEVLVAAHRARVRPLHLLLHLAMGLVALGAARVPGHEHELALGDAPR